MLWLLPEEPRFPPPELGPADGPLAMGGDLSVDRLLSAYSLGIFPWYNEPPILWWSPDPRMILVPNDLRIDRSLARALRKSTFSLSFDTTFADVIRACKAPRRGETGTWITEDMVCAYENLFRLGFAHSAECWQEGQLVGGVYGVALGGAFFGESMFSTVSNASKIAFVALVEHLRRLGFTLVDCQVPSPHMARLGATLVSRTVFLAQLRHAITRPLKPGSWQSVPRVSS